MVRDTGSRNDPVSPSRLSTKENWITPGVDESGLNDALSALSADLHLAFAPVTMQSLDAKLRVRSRPMLSVTRSVKPPVTVNTSLGGVVTKKPFPLLELLSPFAVLFRRRVSLVMLSRRSQASPRWSPSVSSWSGFATPGQLSAGSQTPSPSASGSGVPGSHIIVLVLHVS